MNDVVWESVYGFILGSKELKDNSNNKKYSTGVYIIWSNDDGQVIYVGSGIIEYLRNYTPEDWPEYKSKVLIADYAIIKDYDTELRIKKYLSDALHPLEKVEGLFKGIEPLKISLPEPLKLYDSDQQ